MYDSPMGIFEDYEHCELSLEEYAYIEGYDAYQDGTNNPYNEYPHLSKAWEEGKMHARAAWQSML